MRLMSYNILMDGEQGLEKIITVIKAVDPDVVILQEVLQDATIQHIAEALGMHWHLNDPNRAPLRVGVMARQPIEKTEQITTFGNWVMDALRVTLRDENNEPFTIIGVHLLAYYMWWCELIRRREINNILRYIQQHVSGRHVLIGDFNAFMPDDSVSLSDAPLWVRAQTWPQLSFTVHWALRKLPQVGYRDVFRQFHPDDPGKTLPAPQPSVRLDYLFAPDDVLPFIQRCEVVRTPDIVRQASDHLPIVADFDW